MNVQSVTLRNFMRHDDTQLALPSRGVVLVTGPNGHGKSSIIEAVSYGCWGRTLRGTDPLQAGATKGAVTVATDQVEVRRGRVGKKQAFEWNKLGENPIAYATNTKAQDALEEVVGSFDTWRRCYVFSSQDSAAFTLATDAERKRLLESLLGLDRFDPALTACREDLRAAQSAKLKAEGDVARLQASLAAEQQRVADATEALSLTGPLVDPDALKAEIKALGDKLKAVEDDLAEVSGKLAYLAHAGAAHKAHAQEIQRRLAELASANCPTCEQAIPQALRDRLAQEVAQAQAAADQEIAHAAAEREELLAEQDELAAEKRVLGDRRMTKLADYRAALGRAQQQAHQQRILAEATGRVNTLLSDLQAAQDALADAEGKVVLLGAVEKVLGLKGVRAHVLVSALAGLETVANTWLARIAAAGLKLRLTPYQEKTTGGVRDSLALEVEGAGGGHGYKAASGGERRRIDIAILLALAEVARAAAGADPGTLWADEVFDALDSAGIADVAAVLAELAEDRCVVVISHNPELAEELNPVAHYEVHDGKLSRVA